MVSLSALWLPIVLSAVIVFVASSIMHLVLPYHRSDYLKLPDEEKVLPALRAAGLKRGLYIFPHTTHEEMKSPAMIDKYNQGPVGMMTIFPSGPPVLPKVSWTVVRLLPADLFLRRLSHWAYGCAGNVLSGSFPRGGNRRIPGLRTRNHEQRYLERPALELRPERSDRRTCSTHC